MSRIALLLTDGFADWEYAPIAGPGRAWLGHEIGLFGDGTPISMGGLAAAGLTPTADVPGWAPQVLVIVGGTIWEQAEAPDLTDLLADQAARGGAVGAICGGTLALARAGWLDDIPHTSNAADYLPAHAPGYAGAASYVNSAEAVVAGKVITAPGTAPVSFAAAVFAAAGTPAADAAHMRAMLAAEHQKATP